MLEVKNVELKYGDFVAVHDLSFVVNPGEVFGLLGTNGAGKTTTFRMIMGLLSPSKGEVTYCGHTVSYSDTNEIGYMIEERSLLTKMTVKDIMLFFGHLKDLETDVILKRLNYWLQRFNVEEYKDKKIKELSKGNQQKIQFICSLINNPKLLILDEPFSGLDPINTELFASVIMDFKEKGSMIIFSSHQLDYVENFCQKVTILDKGYPVISGNLLEIKQNYQKRNVVVIAEDIDLEVIKNISGVIEVTQRANDTLVKIESDLVVSNIFDYVKTLKNVRKFEVELPRLSEIFVETVGGHKNEKI
ncbi:MAG: ATP-binding cassette domain-containing protein [Acholeplasmatales bacterium]|jgi:ABC-2 type transport system ATP-binding protein|nr:ATP-binding cassette domain-containing protein [Acholeplasmatales bacterium]